ncbi:SixA phosphatase family protein [Halomonas denitrificans]|nr:histidine phosphatase family protein [Halomonas denitrificans]
MRILLLRHAKSSWDHPGLNDHDRPLSERGERAAPAMGAHLVGTDLQIDRIVSSTAVRARATARLFREAFDPGIEMTTRRDLYHADAATLLAVAVEEAGGNHESRILLVGHNPGMHDLAIDLSGQGNAERVTRLRAKFPTGALAEFEVPLGDSGTGAGHLLRFLRPKDLPDARALGL